MILKIKLEHQKKNKEEFYNYIQSLANKHYSKLKNPNNFFYNDFYIFLYFFIFFSKLLIDDIFKSISLINIFTSLFNIYFF